MQLLRHCAACIAETTTLAMIPALLGMPLFLANYGALSVLRYGRVLTSYPRGQLLQDLSDLPGLIGGYNSADERTPRAVSEWIDMNVGPLPAEAMPDRVAAVIASLIPAKPPLRGWLMGRSYDGIREPSDRSDDQSAAGDHPGRQKRIEPRR